MEEKDEFVCPETYSISIKQAMPFLLDMSYADIQKGVKPSVITTALKLSTEECLEKLRSPTRKYRIGSKNDTFKRCPEAVIFQNFKKGVSYTTSIAITNQRTVPKNIHLYFQSSRHFSLSMDTKTNHQTRIAPGMSYILHVTFLPTDSFRDYVRDVKVVGDEESFSIPVFGIGPRGLTNMPDEITFPPTLVKVQSTASVLVKNSGIVPLEFVHILDKPFSAAVPKAIIPAKGLLETKYTCYPLTTGRVCGNLKTFFKNQLCVLTKLVCEVKSVRVELERQVVNFDDVFMGLTNRKFLTLHNTSEYTFNFSWKLYNEEEEKEEFKKLIELMEEMKDFQVKKCEKLDFLDIVDEEKHADIYERIMEDEKRELLADNADKFLFNSNFFDIIPKVGKVLPKSNFEFLIIFSPQQNIFYNCAAYLDIEGTEKRVRVCLLGNGLGPPVTLCVKKLNASQIYLKDKHQYELAIKNTGIIPAIVTYQPKETKWGGVIECIPHSLELGPDSAKAFIIVFYSEVQGDFVETLDFLVEESKELLQCIFCGTVVCPLLKCVPEALDFGTVSVGMEYTKELCLVNESRVVITYEIEMDEALKDVVKIVPLSGKVDPRSQLQVMVSFSYGTLSTWTKKILLIMWNSRQYTKTIPFNCICSCLKINCIPQKIQIKFCFLNCQYFRTVQLHNPTDLTGYAEYIPPKNPEQETIQCVPQKTNIYLKAREKVEISLKIVVTALGLHELPLYFAVLGGGRQKVCTISCNGQGPVISYHPDEVDFGKVEVLKKYTKKLTLVNDSPISAKVRVYCKSKNTFDIDGSILELAPEETLDVAIIAVFNNAGKIKDTVYIEISESDVYTIKVFGEGVGSSIVFIPELAPKLDLGAILTYQHFTKDIIISNKSNYLHKLYFSKKPVVKTFKEEEEVNSTPTIFIIAPQYLELTSKEDGTITIKCYSKKTSKYEEEYYCHAMIGKSVQPQVIKKFLIVAAFVDPQLNFSKTEFNFNLTVTDYRTEGVLQDVLEINNTTGVPLHLHVTVEENFSIIEEGNKIQYLSEEIMANQKTTREIEYCPNIKEKRRYKQKGRIIFEYENHPKTDIITLFGEVMFPTIKLYPRSVDFECIPLGSTSYKTVVIQNISAMEVSFKWFWLGRSIVINNLNPVKTKGTVFKMHDHDIEHRRKFMDYVDLRLIHDDQNSFENDSIQHDENPQGDESLNQEEKIRQEGSIKPEESEMMVIPESEIMNFYYSNNKYLAEMRKVLFPLLSPFKEKCKEDFYNITPKRFDDQDITKLFCMEPSEGVLEPSEYTLITIGFSPPPNTEVIATAICKIFGGEEEPLIVTGKSTQISYKLDKKSVNFGNQVFCEVCTSELTLTNDGLSSFEFKVVVEETLNRQAESLDVTPKIGFVLPGNLIIFKIEYFPGFPGQFKMPFTLEVGYLEPVTIKVHGYAVVSQVFLHVPRADMELSIEDSYKALAWITPDYLISVQNYENISVMKDEPEDPTGFLAENEWKWVSHNELFPSLMDENLAMERIVAYNHVMKNRNILKGHTGSKSKMPNIPNFFPPPYLVDFGYVVRDIPVCYTVLIYNYGPRKAIVKLLEDNKSALLEKEFKIEFKDKDMLPGETTELYVLFSPSKRRCKEVNIKLEDVFRLSVSHGGIISVQLKAEVTLPSVYINSNALYFEKVYCGNVLRKTKILSNDGKVPSKWFGSISKPTKKEDSSTFFIIPTEGELEPGTKTYLNIYYVPTSSRRIKRTLQIDVEGNESIFVDLFGEGLEAILNLTPTELKFPPTLSFFDSTTFFSIKNSSSIPMEIYFPTFDRTAEDEKKAIEIYLKYKKLKNVYVPFRAAGEKLSDIFASTYWNLVEKFKNKMTKTKPVSAVILDENAEQTKSQKSNVEIYDPLAKYSPEELKNILLEYISAEGFENEFSTKATTYQFEDSADLIEIVEPVPKFTAELTERSGILIIFHGAPTTDYYKTANQFGIELSFPVYSVDRLIIESLVEYSTPSVSDIMDKIDQKFTELTFSDEELLERLEKEDVPYDKIMDKITIILTYKPKKGSKKSSPKEKHSKPPSEKSQGKTNKSIPGTECFLNIIPETIIDILRTKIKQFPFLIIESLNSIFLPKENLCLYTILRAAGTVQYIQLIFFSYTINDYVKNETVRLKNMEAEQHEQPSPPKKKYSLEASPHKSKSAVDDNTTTRKSKNVVHVPEKKISEPEKKSKSSRSPRKDKGGGGDITKKILQGLHKATKTEFEKYEELQREIMHVSEYWDKRTIALKKPYNERTNVSIKKDTTNKDSTRTLKSSVKKQTSVSNDGSDVLSTDGRGLYTWVVLNSSRNRSIDFCKMLTNCILTNCEFQTVINSIRKSMEITYEESETVFSVISMPSFRSNTSTPAFLIKNFKEKDSSDSVRSRSKSTSSEGKGKRRKTSKGSRKSGDSKTTVEIVDPLYSKVDKEDFEFSTRAVLDSGEIRKYQVVFLPVKCGKYSQTYTLEDTNNISYKVVCSAICECPKIDCRPEAMFPKTLENYREKASYDHFVYIKDQKIFDFGSVVVGTNTDKNQLYSSDIVLRNPSSSICKVSITMSNDYFYADPYYVVIRPKCEEKVKLCIRPTKIGTLTAQVYLSVKNNPKVEEFTLACSPCKLEFSIAPRMISFDKVPVSYRAKRTVQMTNSSPINLRWEFCENDWNNGIFDLSEESGYIGLYSVSEIVFHFKPKEELVFQKKHLQIRVFDINTTNEDPCFVDSITIHADSVEYNLEVEPIIDYGEIKGGMETKNSFTIINKGKCEVAIIIQLINNPLEHINYIREFFKIHPQTLTIGAQKTEHISVNFHPTCNFSVENLLLFVINMVESLQTGHIVKSYKVKTSATVFMPSYKLCPYSKMDFGYVQLLTSKKMVLVLTNTGRFSFSFVILNYAKFLESLAKGTGKKAKKEKTDKILSKIPEEKAAKKNKQSDDRKSKGDKASGKRDKETKNKSDTTKISKGTHSSKIDKKKMKITKLEFDGFSIVPSSGIVEPNETLEINIEFTPREVKEYDSEILINIAEIADLQKKKIFKLKAFGCEPKINLRDFENVFLEQYIVKNLDDFVQPKNIDNYCVFVSSEIALYFKLVCVNTTKTIQLHFKNIGFVVANVTARMDDFGKNIFSVSPTNRKVNPYSANFLEVTFKPNSLEIAKAILEISYNASTENRLSIQLFGEACLPQIKILKPLAINHEASLNFGPIYVDSVRKEKIAFKNVGLIKCQVILEISNSDQIFEIIPDSSTIDKLNVQLEEYIADMKEHLLVNLLPDEIAEFEVLYKPVKAETFSVNLNLHTLNNPFDMNKIILNAHSFDNDIVIDNLLILNLNAAQSSNLAVNESIGYLLEFGPRELNKLLKLTFVIRNRSKIHIYKFRFSRSALTFTPRIGHLKPKAFKEVLVVFSAWKPVIKKQERIDCQLSKIDYAIPNDDPLSWDDRQKNICLPGELFTGSSFNQEGDSTPVHAQGSSTGNGTENVSSPRQGEDPSSDDKPIASSSTMKPFEDEYDDITEGLTEGAEPEIITSTEFCKPVPLFWSIAADYCKYACETQIINFRDTYIKEKSIEKFEVKNIGTVALEVKWNINYKSNPLCVKESTSADISKNEDSSALSLQSSSAASLFSKEECMHEEPFLCITINPKSCVIEPTEIGSFDVIFSPEIIECFKGNLESTIENLHPSCSEMNIEINAKALPIPFYFEYEDGSFSNKDLALTFESVGYGTECNRKVFLVNPNAEPLSFEIVLEYRKEFSYFICETPTGKVKGKKKAPIIFSFIPHILGSFKCNYILKIIEKDVANYLLLEGVCREPKVYFTESSITLKPTVPDVKTVKSLALVNDEMFSVAFKFIKKSQFDETQQEKLEVYPIVGTLKPKSKVDIRITFVTSNITLIKFHVKCMVEKLKLPLILHVSASSIEVDAIVSFTDKTGNIVVLNKDAVNIIDLGHTYKGKKEKITFKILNEGQTGLFYDWKFDPKPIAHMFNISVSTEKGFLKIGESTKTHLILKGLRVGTLKQFKVNLNIMYGPNYTIYLNVISDKSNYSFSFTDYQFGYCFIQKGDTKHYSTVLSFKNLDSNPVSLENLFERTEDLTVDFTSSNIPPGGSRNISIFFHPRKVGPFRADVPFSFGNMEHTISITGEAMPVKLELLNPKDKFINLGEVMVGTVKKYRVSVVNCTPARMDVHFSLFDNLIVNQNKTGTLDKIDFKIPVPPPVPQEGKKSKDAKKRDKSTDTKNDKQKTDSKNENKGKKQKDQEKEMEIQKVAEALAKQKVEERIRDLKSLLIVPNMFMDIPPHGKGQFEVVFQPSYKIKFEEKIYFETQDHFEPLCIIKVSSVCPNFSLDSSEMRFSGVIVNCSKTQFITLQNTGDVTGSFNWIIHDKRNIFDIEPKQGFVMPKSDMKIRVTFSPKQEKCEYIVKTKCILKQYKEPLHLVLKGNVIKIPEPKETVVFNCNVREKAVQSVVLTNTSSETWIIYPEISDRCFSTPREVSALPFADTQIVISYFPKSMTTSKPNEATMFIKLPTGGAVVYKLIGNAGPPAVKKRIEKEIRCKQNFYEPLLIQNWLDIKQSFDVITKVTSPLTTKTLYKLLGVKTVHLDGMQSKQYRWGVYLVNDVPIEFMVMFKNPDTGEYQYYEISLKVLPAEPSETISFHTRVREPIMKQFTLDNPVDVPVTFALDCVERNLTFEKSLTLKPYTTTKVDLTYTPLNREDISTVLNARCEELGTYSFSVKLFAEPPKLEKNIVFKAELGEKAIKTILFKNTFDRVVEFSYQFDNQEFYMERCNPVSIGELSKILVGFDPSSMNCIKSKLFLNSLVAGEYIYPLEGEALTPTPKGPFPVKPNYPASIEFRNPFNEERTFTFQLQPDVFFTELKEDLIKPKKSTRISVNACYSKASDLPCTTTGKLTVYSTKEPELEWTYYLQINQT